MASRIAMLKLNEGVFSCSHDSVTFNASNVSLCLTCLACLAEYSADWPFVCRPCLDKYKKHRQGFSYSYLLSV